MFVPPLASLQVNLVFKDAWDVLPEAAHKFKAEILSYLRSNKRGRMLKNTDALDSDDEHDVDGDVGNSCPSLNRYDEAERHFCKCFNMDWRKQLPQHRREADEEDISDTQIVSDMSESFRRFLLAAMPPVPSPSKWTKAGPCLDFLVGSWLIHKFLPRGYEIAFSSMAFAQWKEGAEDYTLVEELHFSQVAGSRSRANKLFLQCTDSRFRVVLLAIVMEPIRFLTRCLLSCCRTVQDPGKPPKLLDIMFPPMSFLTTCQQYLATLLVSLPASGQHRMLLLASLMGHDTTSEWISDSCRKFPDIIRLVRRTVVYVSSWIYRRHEQVLLVEPWSLCQLSDDRVPDETKSQIRSNWDAKNVCCVRRGMAYGMKKRGLTAETLSSPKTPCQH